jgi:hypothetical protein
MTTKIEFKPINMESAKQILGKSKQAVIYGTTDTGWEWLQSQFQTRKDSPLERIFNYVIGDDLPDHKDIIPPGAVTTLEGRSIVQLSSGARSAGSGDKHLKTKRICKGALVNWAFEIWKRKDAVAKDESARMPLIVTIDIDGNTKPMTAENALSKTKTMHGRKLNDIVTHAEIRRLAKLCNDESIDKELREEIKKNIIFVRLKKVGDEMHLEKVAAPWEDSSWDTEFSNRKKLSSKVEKDYNWRKELNTLVAEERRKRASETEKAAEVVVVSTKKETVDLEKPKESPKPLEKTKEVSKSSAEIAKEAEQRLMQGLSSMFGSGFNFALTN